MRYPISLVSYLLFLVALFTTANVSAQSGSNPSLSTVLNPDGSVKQNVTGSFDSSGFRMSYGPNGEPRFSERATLGTCSDSWDTNFSLNGADNDVHTVVGDGAGNVYIGGNFSAVGTVAASRIAKWDGTTWSALGPGVGGGNVFSIAVSGSDVYVGGGFTSAGGVPANHIAKWNGSSWSAMGPGLGVFAGDYVSAIAVSGTNVYAGGHFADAGSLNYIARWDGASWVSMGTGMNLTVYTIAVLGSNVYAGGIFNMAGGVSVARVAKWDGASWSAMGTGVFGSTVFTLKFSGSDLYAGTSVGILAKWNGTTWDTVGTVGGPSPTIYSIAFSGTDIYIGGEFTTAGGSPANRIAKWNGTQFSSLGPGVGDSILNIVMGMAFSGSTLLVGGDFPTAGGSIANHIARYDSGTWTPFAGTGVDAGISAVAIWGTDVYVAGNFSLAGSVAANRIAKWNGSTWSALGTGLVGSNISIRTLAVSGGYLYAAGQFGNIGGVSANSIARWNGTAWSALGTGVTGMNGTISSMTVVGGDVYVGGSFNTAGGVAAIRIAKWNGNTWSGLPGSSIIPNDVTSIAAMGSDLYIGSGSTTADNPNYLLKFDGTNWTGLSIGFGGHGITSLAVLGTDLYVTGAFPSIGGLTVNRIAKWNGSSWSALGSGLPGNSSLVKVVVMGSDVIAFGDFTSPFGRIARWNGSAWSPLGNGISGGTPTGAAVGGGNLWVGGSFTSAGCNLSAYLARWRETVWTGTTNTDWHTVTNWGSGSIPGAGAGVTISSTDASITSANVTLSSLVITNGRTLTVAQGRTLTVIGDLDLINGSIAGFGDLVVLGNLSINVGNITNLSNVFVSGSLYLNLGKIMGSGRTSVLSCQTNAIAGGDNSSFVSTKLDRCVNSAGTYRFPVGTDNVYSPIEISNAVGNGTFLVEPKSGAYSAPAAGLPANRLQRWWQLTSGGITQADLRFYYSDTEVLGLENRYRTYRIDGGSATQLPSSIDAALNRATATGVTAFSSFTLAEGTPAPGTLSGRLTNPSGRGASGIIVTLTDDQNNVRYAVTNPFGYYRFMDVLTFRTYTVNVTSKKFTFAAPSRVVDFDEYTTGVNFVSSDN